jgi:Holliday junction resolvasome RuvABC ATP-dependent DNA helicase subunit
MFVKQDNNWTPMTGSDLRDAMPKGVYCIRVPMMGPIFYENIKEDFSINHKIYGHPQLIVDRVKKTFENTKGNLGVLLNGVKGTGKSVTAEMLCNQFGTDFNMPCILINENINGLAEILSELKQDVIVFVDEFEKVFSREEDGYVRDYSKNILTIMDGALKSEYRRLFVFTTNEIRINENMLSRPGRIRYIINFGNMTPSVIKEVIDDLLINKSNKEEILDYILNLQIITMDIVKSVIEECNIHGDLPVDFKSIFNATEKTNMFNIYEGCFDEKNQTKPSIFPLHEKIEIIPRPNTPKQWKKGAGVRFDSEFMGYIDSFDALNKSFVLNLFNVETDEYDIPKTFTWEEAKVYTYSPYEF